MIPQNINTNNIRSISAKLCNDMYFDFMLYKGDAYNTDKTDVLTIADFTTLDINDGIWYSTVVWSEAVNNGVLLEDIGFTGPDNGFISFRKDRISNEDFLNILINSKYKIDSADTRFFMSPVTGNTLNFDYPMYLENDEDGKYISLQGGFYQGFYKLHGFDYQTLPNGIDTEWNLFFELRPRSDYEVGVTTINHIHPENKGIFFYMGTRAENKFWNLYKTESAVTEELKRVKDDENYTNAELCDEKNDTNLMYNNVTKEEWLKDEPAEPEIGYFADGYTVSASTEDCPCVEETFARMQDRCENFYFGDDDYNKEKEYVKPLDKFSYLQYVSDYQMTCSCPMQGNVEHREGEWYISDLYDYKYNSNSHCCTTGCEPVVCEEADYKKDCSCDDYFQDTYFNDMCVDSDKAIEEEYVGNDAIIDESKIEDSFGHELLKKGYYEIESDNKFLMFDRTLQGFNVNNWVEGTKVTLTGRQDWQNFNYFLLMNATPTGYTTKNIDEYLEANSLPYNIYNDIKNNAFALRITDSGAIGYRYSVLDCEASNKYDVIEEYSADNVVTDLEWNKINVKISILNPNTAVCDPFKGKRTMKIYFYVNGKLVFVSKELPEFRFKELNDVYQKQEAVPYNISLGGGTQGLLESILPDYYNTPDYIFPLEKSYCGSFVGDIKGFKIIDGYVNYLTIKNYLSENKI